LEDSTSKRVRQFFITKIIFRCNFTNKSTNKMAVEIQDGGPKMWRIVMRRKFWRRVLRQKISVISSSMFIFQWNFHLSGELSLEKNCPLSHIIHYTAKCFLTKNSPLIPIYFFQIRVSKEIGLDISRVLWFAGQKTTIRNENWNEIRIWNSFTYQISTLSPPRALASTDPFLVHLEKIQKEISPLSNGHKFR
jgi:hypothetical protein